MFCSYYDGKLNPQHPEHHLPYRFCAIDSGRVSTSPGHVLICTNRGLNSYGELIPRSILGRLFTVPLLVFGLLLIALPSFVLGRNFAIVFDAMSNQIKQPVSRFVGEGKGGC